MSSIPFVKYSGNGNTFLIIEGMRHLDRLIQAAPRICSSEDGYDVDGLLILNDEKSSRKALWTLKIINADGSLARMCGNGLRCVMAYLYERDGLSEASIITDSGVVACRYPQTAEVNLGQAIRQDLPHGLLNMLHNHQSVAQPIQGLGYYDVGNQHLIIQFEYIPAKADWHELGTALQNSEWFPEGINVTAVGRPVDGVFPIRTFERGVGLTQACGSATCSTAAFLHDTYTTSVSLEAFLFDAPGGRLTVHRSPEHDLWLSGDVFRINEGTFNMDRLE